MTQKIWRKKVNIEILTDKIIEYLVKRDFELIKTKIDNGYHISAGNSPSLDIAGCVNVSVKSIDQGFAVEVAHSSDVDKIYNSVFLTTLFGGGYFMLKKLKSRETWMAFQREFWKYINKTVDELYESNL